MHVQQSPLEDPERLPLRGRFKNRRGRVRTDAVLRRPRVRLQRQELPETFRSVEVPSQSRTPHVLRPVVDWINKRVYRVFLKRAIDLAGMLLLCSCLR